MKGIILYIRIDDRKKIFKEKYFYLIILSFLAVALPWHLIMILKYGWPFLDEYVGYHLLERYRYDILNSVQSSDALHYVKVIIHRSASWWLVFLATIPAILSDIRNKVERKKLLLLLFWLMFIIIFFTSSATKLHHYILIIYVPFAILIAYGLYYYYVRRSALLLPALIVLLMNVNSPIAGWVSDFGETKFLAEYILNYALKLPMQIVNGLIVILICRIFFEYFFKNRTLAVKSALFGIFLFSFILPFDPDRVPLAKKNQRNGPQDESQKYILL